MKAAAAFAMGFGAGMVFLAGVLWSTGSLVTHAQAGRTVAETIQFKEPQFDRGERKQPVAIPTPLTPPQPSPAEPAPAATPTPAAADRPAPLAMPIAGVDPHTLKSNFSDTRGGHAHEALDIMAPRGTAVLAVAEGNVVKLFTSKQGGLTVYQFDNSGTWCYYYAHLDRYAPALKEGTLLRKGDVLGYVGSTGDASPDAPHLHFAIFKLGPEKHWWQGTAIDPLPQLR
jgi:murein DD-endopeptidase MepM/ murein hydrolase activator NlpD